MQNFKSPQKENNIVINLLDHKLRPINHLETHITPAPTSLSTQKTQIGKKNVLDEDDGKLNPLIRKAVTF